MRLLPFLLLFLLPACTTRYYLVRHAERLNNEPISPLSAAGLARAEVLRDTLRHKGIREIYASTYQRTQQTAQPLATALGLPLSIYQPDTTAGLLAALEKIKGRKVLVVGHSNTIPQLVEGLSLQSVTIGDQEFNKLFIVTVKKGLHGKRRSLLQTTYGKETM